MQAIILDTETHTLNGQPIEIAYAPIEITNGKLSLDKSQVFDQLYTVDEPISFAAMAVHHILESDLVGKPHYTTFKLPAETQYIIGHNIDYDIRAIEKCGVDTSHIKAICTLALARLVWPDAEAAKSGLRPGEMVWQGTLGELSRPQAVLSDRMV